MAMNVICPVVVSADVKRTLEYYANVLGFKYADHTDSVEKFAAVSSDSREIKMSANAIVRRKLGEKGKAK